jgi:hypothetical protein
MLAHLREHTYAGHHVPAHAIDRLAQERNTLGDMMPVPEFDLGAMRE